MSVEQPPKNKMMQGAPDKKEFHFAATAEHYAEVVLAQTIQEAEAIYQKIKRPIGATPPPQSTAPVDEKETV